MNGTWTRCRIAGCDTETRAFSDMPEKPSDVCILHWSEIAGKARENAVLDRIIADAKEQPEPSYLAEEGPFGDPERDMGIGE